MKKKLLLHSCCGPCSTVCISKLLQDFDVDVFYFNPNIYPKTEFDKRFFEEQKVCNHFGINLVCGDYCDEKFFEITKGLEIEKEGGTRCKKCFELRLEATAKFAKENGYDMFATTLSVSPYKHTPTINEVGNVLSLKYGIKFLPENFKKQDGYKKSIEMSRDLGLYRQNYCGCKFSLEARLAYEKQKLKQED